MHATVDIDKLGRLVIPKKVRDALHLRPGDALNLELRGEEVVLSPKTFASGLLKADGLWVYDTGSDLSTDDVNRWLSHEHEQRLQQLLGENLES